MNFINAYEDNVRAESYARLEYPNTYYLAYRDLPDIISEYTKGKKAVDFGCGTGRSTRFLKNLGFDAVGIDISSEMIEMAKKLDPSGEYYIVQNADYKPLKGGNFDLILSVFTFDNIPDHNKRCEILTELRSLLKPSGKIVMLDTTPQLYVNNWASFTTTSFEENRYARGGDSVKVIMHDVPDKRPVEDIIWFHSDYMKLFEEAGLDLLDTQRPLGSPAEPYLWVSETHIAPWVIYVLRPTKEYIFPYAYQ